MITWHHRHVCGHKDDWADSLDEYEKLNVEMDALAKRCWDRFSDQRVEDNPKSWRIGFPTVTIKGERVGSKLRQSLRQKTALAKWLYWWGNSQRKKGYIAGPVDHVSLGRAARSIPIHERVWAMKFAHGTLGVGKWMNRWRFSHDQGCPRCGEQEDHNHIWTCPASAQWSRNMSSLSKWLIRIKMPDVERMALVEEWEGWKDSRAHQKLEDCSELFQEAMNHQRQIGWDNLTKGFLSERWNQYLARLTCMGYPITSANFIRKIWTWGGRMWKERNEMMCGNMGEGARVSRQVNSS